jgi:hypothetical protein
MGVASLFLKMFLRKLKNRSDSISIQIISKVHGKYKVIKTIGTGTTEQEIQKFLFLGKQELERIGNQSKLFVSENDIAVEQRIEAHICISFTAYCIYKELERLLHKEKSAISLKKAAELTHNMYELTYTLPESKHTKSKLLNMDDDQAELYQIIQKNH